MKRIPVISGNLSSIGYNPETHILEIQFRSGAVYQYFQVPQEMYVNFMTAESHDNYFNNTIRNKIKYQKVDYEPVLQNQKIFRDEIDIDDGDDGDNYDFSDDIDKEPDDLSEFGEWIHLGTGQWFWDDYTEQ